MATKRTKPPKRPADVAEHAYGIWERAGRPEGRDLDHWLLAEAELSGASRPAAKRRTSKTSKKVAGAKAGKKVTGARAGSAAKKAAARPKRARRPRSGPSSSP